MSDEQFKFPPGLTSPDEFYDRWKHKEAESVQDWCRAVQRDAVMAERREVEEQKRRPFVERLAQLLHEFNSKRGTPPEILAEYLQNCLSAFNGAQHRRQEHFEQPKAYDKCNCTGAKTYYWCCNTRCCFHCNKPFRVQSV